MERGSADTPCPCCLSSGKAAAEFARLLASIRGKQRKMDVPSRHGRDSGRKHWNCVANCKTDPIKASRSTSRRSDIPIAEVKSPRRLQIWESTSRVEIDSLRQR